MAGIVRGSDYGNGPRGAYMEGPPSELMGAMVRNNGGHQLMMGGCPSSSQGPPGDLNSVLWYPMRYPVGGGGPPPMSYPSAPPGAGNIDRDEAMRYLGLNNEGADHRYGGRGGVGGSNAEAKYMSASSYAAEQSCPPPGPLNGYTYGYPSNMSSTSSYASYQSSAMSELSSSDQRNNQDQALMMMPLSQLSSYRNYLPNPSSSAIREEKPSPPYSSQLPPAVEYARQPLPPPSSQLSKRRASGGAEDRYMKKRSLGKEQMKNVMSMLPEASRGGSGNNMKEAPKPSTSPPLRPDIVLQPSKPFPSGGRYCRYPECTRKAQGRTEFCISHGGGRRCASDGCERGAAGASSFCKKHGGGHRCSFEGCEHSSQGPSAFCIRHGGGYRCRYPDCDKSARSAQSFCYRHGGGRKGCEAPGCMELSVGTTTYCKKHTREMNAQQAAQVVNQRGPSSTAAAAAAAYPANEGGNGRGRLQPQLEYGSYPPVTAMQQHHHMSSSMPDDPIPSKSSLAFSMMNDGESSYLSF